MTPLTFHHPAEPHAPRASLSFGRDGG